VEQEAAGPDEQIPVVCDLEDRVMFIFAAVQDPLHTEIQEQEIGKRIDDLRRIYGCIIVL
jgi:hypothetical protein